MNKFLLTLLLLFIFSEKKLAAQKDSRSFEISLPETKVPGSIYNKIFFIDSRLDTTQMGIVQVGAFNKKVKVISEKPLAIQIADIFDFLIDSTAKNGELLLQLRQLSFAEITGAVSEKGYCYFRAGLYTVKNDRYKKLNFIDTVILIKSMDVTKSLFRNGSKIITSFISDNLLQQPANDEAFSLHDLIAIDSIEKSSIRIFYDSSWQDGLYTDWLSFKNQQPSKKITAEIKDGKLTSVKAENLEGKMAKVKSKEVYAVVYNGQPFIATDYGYYLLEKRNNDLFFTGKAKVTANAGDVIAASLFFGIIGGLIASDTESVFEMKIDHLNGGFIRLKEIKTINEY
jgi:hypothetical protein